MSSFMHEARVERALSVSELMEFLSKIDPRASVDVLDSEWGAMELRQVHVHGGRVRLDPWD